MTAKSEWTARDVADQSGKRFVITGGNSGIGLEAARVLAQRGGEVVLACRNEDKAAAAVADIHASAPDATVTSVALDLASLDSVRACAEELLTDGRSIDVLINNAGIMAVPRGLTADGFERQFGTNHLGHFALTGLVLDLVLAADKPRVVTVSSMAHRSGRMNFDDLQSEKKYTRMGAYSQSKLANLLFTMELQRRFRRMGFDDAVSVGCHPGLSSTNLGAGIMGGKWSRAEGVVEKLTSSLAQSASDGALPTLRAATDRTAKGGDYFGPKSFRESRGPSVKVKPRSKAFDVHDARGLWEESVRLTGVSYDQLNPDLEREG